MDLRQHGEAGAKLAEYQMDPALTAHGAHGTCCLVFEPVGTGTLKPLAHAISSSLLTRSLIGRRPMFLHT